MARTSKVVLEVPEIGMKEEFDIDHAERLLRMPNNGGWQLPASSKFVFTLEHGIKYSTDTRNSEGTKK